MKMELVNLNKSFQDVSAVKNLNLKVNDGELVAFLGPSGCGKTTTLLTIAGIYKPTSGDIFFDGERVNSLQPKERDIGMVFQSYALYPHMNAYQNIVFSLVLKKRPKEEMQREAKRVSDMLGIGHLLDRKASQLSGGQQQRVALARALIKQPKLLLFDEPLSNLDARLRMSMREEIRRLQTNLGITSVYVTHDQVEAMTMADRVAVMHNGDLLAYVTPEELHERPRTLFIGQFIGSPSMNILDAQLKSIDGSLHIKLTDGTTLPIPGERTPKSCKDGDMVKFGIRPEDVKLDSNGSVRGKVTFIESLGREHLIVSNIGEQRMQLLTEPGNKISLDSNINISVDMRKAQFFDAETGLTLLWE